MKLRKGVQCLDYCERSFILATGSKDGLIRIWNPCVASTPENIFRGHKSAISCLHFKEDFLFSLSRDMHLFIWDINRISLLQQLQMKFLNAEKIFINKNSIQCQTADQSIIIICSNSFSQFHFLNYAKVKCEKNIEIDKREEIRKKLLTSTNTEEIKKVDNWMSYCISKGCPYLSLKIDELPKLEIQANLPTTDRMKRLNFKYVNLEDLLQVEN
ncbi:uncharacterized protein LOC111619991 [Centruroides sculpturatus]|uniref:uncharacterized protein LOC111619991 n=1 Tax=Centruroides sculpturatus TaxID=218467 RepID=UPI000C6CB1F5|nr:uncharacterized protein LOC111619991 [Centruroides sculpturatus]